MKTEKHIIKGHFKGKRPHVKVTAYELSTVDCSADKMSGYYSQEATLISDDPEPGYDFAGWSVTGSNVTGNNVRFEGDITAKANYSAHVYNVALQNDGHGTITANKTTGNLGDTITLSNTPATHYHFSGYSLTGATLTSNQFNIETNDVTAKGWFSEDPKYNLTLQNDGHGSIGAGKTTGYQGDTTTLSNTANNGYVFSAYSVTGATLNGSTLTFGAQDATAKAWFSAVPQSALYYSNNKCMASAINKDTYTGISANISKYRYAVIKFNHISTYTSYANDVRFYTTIGSNSYAISTYPKNKLNSKFNIWKSGLELVSAVTKNKNTVTGTAAWQCKNISGGNVTALMVFDLNNRCNCSSYVNKTYMYSGTYKSAFNNIRSVYMYSYTSHTGSYIQNVRIAGFANFNDATAYNG